MNLAALFLLIAFILFALAAFNVAGRFNLVAGGLAFATLSVLLPLLHG